MQVVLRLVLLITVALTAHGKTALRPQQRQLGNLIQKIDLKVQPHAYVKSHNRIKSRKRLHGIKKKFIRSEVANVQKYEKDNIKEYEKKNSLSYAKKEIASKQPKSYYYDDYAYWLEGSGDYYYDDTGSGDFDEFYTTYEDTESDGSVCENKHASCDDDYDYYYYYYEDICDDKWFSKNCPVTCGKCSSSGPSECSPPCKNGGTCSSGTCTCLGGWTGNACQTAIPSECSPPCKNGGTCSSGTCTCLAGWTGNACQTASSSDCNPPCKNGGTCSSGTCTCSGGWTGNACQAVCGKANRATRIVGGVTTEVNEYPWQVALVAKGSSKVDCGGSLINDRWVLTAAHCTEYGVDQILLGNHLQSQTDSAERRINVKRVVDHPNYNSKTLNNDFSLLELSTPVNLESVAPEIQPVCLPSASNPAQYENVPTVVSGWGTTSPGGSQPNALKETTVTTMTNSVCSRKYPNEDITKAMICAAAPNTDSCQGDSGGPLVRDVGGYFNLIGVVSWGYGCADAKYPGVYARVTDQIDWINKTSSTS